MYFAVDFEKFQEDLLHVRLTKLSVEGLNALLKEVEELEPAFERLSQALKENAISGRVLMHCELSELKSLLGLSFGHWEIFRLLVHCLRDIEKLQPTLKLTEVDSMQPTFPRQKSVIEKQVSECDAFSFTYFRCGAYKQNTHPKDIIFPHNISTR